MGHRCSAAVSSAFAGGTYPPDALGEIEEAIPLDALTEEKLVLKKDAEELGDVRQGEQPYRNLVC